MSLFSNSPNILMYFLITMVLCFFFILNLIPFLHKCKKCEVGVVCTYCETKSSKILEWCIISFLIVIIIASIFSIVYKLGLLGAFKQKRQKIDALAANKVPAVDTSESYSTEDEDKKVVEVKKAEDEKVAEVEVEKVPVVDTSESYSTEAEGEKVVEIKESSVSADEVPVVDTSESSSTEAEGEKVVSRDIETVKGKTPTSTTTYDHLSLNGRRVVCERLSKFIDANNNSGDIEQCQKNWSTYQDADCPNKTYNGITFQDKTCHANTQAGTQKK